MVKNGNGLDFNNYELNSIYYISNLQSQTNNAPVKSPYACIYIVIGTSSSPYHLLIGIDGPLMYGKYANTEWVELM